MVWSVYTCFVIWNHGMFKTNQPTESGVRLQQDPSCVEVEECTRAINDSLPWTEARQSLCLFCKPWQDNRCRLRCWGSLLKRTSVCGLGVPGKPGASAPLGSQGSGIPGLTKVPSMPTQGQVLGCTRWPKLCQLEGNPCLVSNSSAPASRDHIPPPSLPPRAQRPEGCPPSSALSGHLLTRRFPSWSLSRQLILTLCDSSKRQLITDFAEDPSSYDLAWYLYSFRLCPKIICICLNG